MQGEGTEQGMDGEDQGNFLDVFGVEMHPQSTFSVFSFGFSGRSIANSLCFSFPCLSPEGGFGEQEQRGEGQPVAEPNQPQKMSKEPPNGPN